MAKTALVTARVEPATKQQLRRMATRSGQSESALATVAVEHYVAALSWQADLIARRLMDAKSGGAVVPHAKVKAWMKSWGRAGELPKPRR